MIPNESIHRAGRIPMSLVAAALFAISAPLAAGCTTDTQEEPTGQLVFPLLQPGPEGALYRLNNAIFDITSTTTRVTTTVDGSGAQSEVAVSLAPGLYSVLLRDGWELDKSTDGGNTFAPVGALLGSFNPDVLRVLANQPAIVEFDFLIRNINGTLEIKLGVTPSPRQLVGGFVIDTATDGLAGYADPANRLLDFAIYFKLSSLASGNFMDGSKAHIYTATPDQELGNNMPTGSAVATEFYNDNLGILSGKVAADLTSAFLQYTVAAQTDGTITLSGTVQGGAELDFGPHAIDAILPTIGADGFPNDVFFYDSTSPFTLISSQGTLTGILRVRHIVP
jgi:hypothetical protein